MKIDAELLVAIQVYHTYALQLGNELVKNGPVDMDSELGHDYWIAADRIARLVSKHVPVVVYRE
jgi:hypothetical protein